MNDVQLIESGVEDGQGRAEVEVRRRGAVTGAVGVAGCMVALAWLARAMASGAPLDWALCLAMGAVGIVNLLAFVDARTPVLVADDQGVRVRRGQTWHGLTWDQVDRVEHRPRRGPARDGSLSFVGAAADDDPLTVPLSLTTRVVGTDDLPGALRALADGATEVVEPVAEPVEPVAVQVDEEPDEQDVAEHDLVQEDDDQDDVQDEAREGLAARLRRWVDERRPVRAEREDEDEVAEGAGAGDTGRPGSRRDDAGLPAPTPTVVASSTPLPWRDLSSGTRADVVLGAAALRLDTSETDDEDDRPRLPEARELRRDGSVNLVEETSVWGDRVRPIAKPGEAVAPLVLDDYAPLPVVDPVIGPELAAARTRLGLSVDQLADRTRIRPHVIESIEVDDFAPCGGDFYAKGHLRTLARVLGTDSAPLLATYDERYADAPIDARRVFEAELATGAGGSIRGTRGGPNWSVLVAAAMTLILVWSVARLVVDRPADLAPPTPRLNNSGGVDNGASTGTGAAVPVELTAAGGGAQVTVRSGSQVVFDDQLAFMQTIQLDVAPPVRIGSSDGGLLVTVDGTEEGPLGATGQQAEDVFVP
ncbi:helix-turn-helix domain-containing protein [Nocardioides sp. AX2bis]|uniref:helix-turn-helix domain-containing protein n=1 Tax=Nocardioides sp. AX2bis TaxID=2653157 RepID=UPI0012F3F1ED|nr:helix-turn-helix domain-containing protein [Nocardioides sp. AX2bis]VXB41190.1 conserved hypothetical protein [Nocardioides sp. AX2bis]